MENDQLHTDARSVKEETWLLQQLALGSKEAYMILYQRYQPVLQRYLYPFKTVEEPAEIIQDIFLKIWIKREALTAVRSFEQYIFRMARNRLLDLQKSNKARHHRETDVQPALNGHHSPAEERLEYKEFYEYAVNAIGKLPERQRRIYELSVFQDHSLDEISQRLGLSKSVVVKQLYLATRFVRREVQKYTPLLLLLIGGLFFLHFFFANHP